jgi:hypothetical protein
VASAINAATAVRQLGTSDRQAQVVCCRSERDSIDGASVDVVADPVEDPRRITDVRSGGCPPNDGT